MKEIGKTSPAASLLMWLLTMLYKHIHKWLQAHSFINPVVHKASFASVSVWKKCSTIKMFSLSLGESRERQRPWLWFSSWPYLSLSTSKYPSAQPLISEGIHHFLLSALWKGSKAQPLQEVAGGKSDSFIREAVIGLSYYKATYTYGQTNTHVNKIFHTWLFLSLAL